MSDFKSDLPHIKWGLLALLLASGASGAAILFSQNFLAGSQQAHKTAERQLTEARRNLSAATDDQQNMASYAQEYSILLKRNIIGNEQRLDWVDALERLRHRNFVLDFSYNISPQHSYQPPVSLDPGNFNLNRSDMTLSFDLLHTGQLVNFFNALQADSKGWFMLDGCSITRIAGTINNSGPGTTPQLKAECKGGWLTLKNRNMP
ncbi:MAG: hypothetical protein GC139_06685 [Sideroxydans sp.]|nr:hypothetical protein [Sideroxydans sp.]